ncbi:hypothetical protein [Kingella sp. (in: b-proteobacteria)]|uniref:hypothetical protein n=1 Tax=Kingella sp. (in: b-proteobacteria) TaxID=2020713 RepID=UPI0026DAA0E8|nr:hypothetical protein [Kingella sp. (in: b-proteobacteria)]MDO4658651.1 hypothetical protein [Kingella sp. (in: b-proteobacteria)]
MGAVSVGMIGQPEKGFGGYWDDGMGGCLFSGCLCCLRDWMAIGQPETAIP